MLMSGMEFSAYQTVGMAQDAHDHLGIRCGINVRPFGLRE